MTRRLQPLPTGTPAEGSIQVAGAPNGREQRVQSDCREAHAHYCGDPRAQCRGGPQRMFALGMGRKRQAGRRRA